MRRPEPFTPSWFGLNLIALLAGVAVMVGLGLLLFGEGPGWPLLVVFVVVMVGLAMARGAQERRTGSAI